MTEQQRFKRKFADSDVCNRCNVEKETAIHCVRDCPVVAPLWDSLIDRSHRSIFFSLGLQDWVSFNLSKSWSVKFAITVWQIWKQRNDCIFNSKKENGLALIPLINSHIREIQSFAKLPQSGSLKEKSGHCCYISWEAPSAGWIKLNIDGSHQGATGNSACGGVARDDNGKWIFGFIKNLGKKNSTVAEMWGVLIGLQIAKEKGYTRVVVESDSRDVLALIEKTTESNQQMHMLARRIRDLYKEDVEIVLSHAYREANKLADALAVQGHRFGFDTLVLDDPPSWCCKLCQDDARGLGSSRWRIGVKSMDWVGPSKVGSPSRRKEGSSSSPKPVDDVEMDIAESCSAGLATSEVKSKVPRKFGPQGKAQCVEKGAAVGLVSKASPSGYIVELPSDEEEGGPSALVPFSRPSLVSDMVMGFDKVSLKRKGEEVTSPLKVKKRRVVDKGISEKASISFVLEDDVDMSPKGFSPGKGPAKKVKRKVKHKLFDLNDDALVEVQVESENFFPEDWFCFNARRVRSGDALSERNGSGGWPAAATQGP
ncbi:putative reverse transcriptase [Senna tora]|uniref:Putative reverse transcriptase n=1 Tax=Senna tora TaxID=362788 RepID=A0A834XFX3_9FABA|nr:putative reverse transcriptase [Senna tora]